MRALLIGQNRPAIVSISDCFPFAGINVHTISRYHDCYRKESFSVYFRDALSRFSLKISILRRWEQRRISASLSL